MSNIFGIQLMIPFGFSKLFSRVVFTSALVYILQMFILWLTVGYWSKVFRLPQLIMKYFVVRTYFTTVKGATYGKIAQLTIYQDETGKQTFLVILLLITMGFMVFSPFSSILIMDILGCPISLPELLFLPFLVIFRKRYQFSSPGNIRTIVLLLAWLSMVGFSLVAGNDSLSTILASSRTYLLIIIAL